MCYDQQPICWNYSQEHPYKGDLIAEDRPMYPHLYYSHEKTVEDKNRLMHLEDELKQG